MSKAVAYVGQFSDSGSRNSFYTLKNRKYGFKGFPNRELAEFAYAVQSKLAEHNLTPRTYSTIGRIRVPNYFVKQDSEGNMTTITKMVLSDWGYLTEIARPYYGHDNCSEHCSYEPSCPNYKKIHDLMDSMEDYGISYSDGHNGNLGWVTRKKKRVLVVIDVGRESIGSVDTSMYPDVEYDDYDDDMRSCDCSECVACTLER